MYHAVENPDLNNDRMGLAVLPETFCMQMKYLKENGFHVMDLLEFVDTIKRDRSIPAGSIVITFDDGFKSVLKNALPVLKKFNFPATLFVNVYFIEGKLPRGKYWSEWETLNWDGVRELHDAGFSIGAHGLTHRRLTGLSEHEIRNEVGMSGEMIGKNINSEIRSFSYPHGAFNKKTRKILEKENFICSCSSIEGANDARSNMFSLRRTEITAFDNTVYRFEKKLSGSYDWLGCVKTYG